MSMTPVPISIFRVRAPMAASNGNGDGITNYLENGGTLEVAQWIAGHADSRTTKLYRTTNLHDSCEQKFSLEDVERIRY